jgi:ACR3 family arsenite efflux pump ArsB
MHEKLDYVRRIVVFLLGVLCFLKGVLAPQNTIPELIIGMIMVGVLPIENIGIWQPRYKRRKREEDEL